MSITIPEVPLYWRFKNNLDKCNGIPEKLNFTFDYDEELNLYIQPRDSKLLEILNNIYKAEANIGYNIDGHNLGKSYGSDYIKYLEKFVNSSENKIIVDVGCGGCTLLEHFLSKGINVIGVDPSPVALKAGIKKGIQIKNEYLDNKTLKKNSVNYITQMDVLEHVFNPVEILKNEKEAINSDGLIFINVPNCENSIQRGDISMLIHQHVNMYSRKSLANVIRKAGLYVYDMTLSDYGSAIYCAVTKNPNYEKYNPNDFSEFDLNWNIFEEKAMERINKFKNFFEKIYFQDNGFFIFQRILPYLCATSFELKGRYFDNNALWHKKYLDGVPNKIENEKDFLNNPTKNLFIFSYSFGNQLVKKFSSVNKNTNYYTQKDVFDN